MPLFAHLDALGSAGPYGICKDDDGNVWVASRGGLFKLDKYGSVCLIAEKNSDPKKIGAFCTVKFAPGSGQIVTKYSHENSNLSELAVYGKNGERVDTKLVDDKIHDLAVSESGDVFITTQSDNYRKSEILRAHIDDFSVWDPVAISREVKFEYLCVLPSSANLAVTTGSQPLNPYSNQEIQIYDYSDRGRLVKSFGEAGRKPGKLMWSRGIQSTSDGKIIVLDTFGRIQVFNDDGNYVGLWGNVPAHVGNGFCLSGPNTILVTCSGRVPEPEIGDAVENGGDDYTAERASGVYTSWIENVEFEEEKSLDHNAGQLEDQPISNGGPTTFRSSLILEVK